MAGRIEDYALVGDMETAALVCRDGSIDWLCFPRFDSAACFAALLGTDDNGHWTLRPKAGGPATRRRYVEDSLVLESEWDTPEGTVRIIDFMPPRDGVPDVVRIVEGVSGAVPMESVLRMRFDYGHIVPWVNRRDGNLVGIAGPDSLWLRTPVETHGHDFATESQFTVRAGERVPFTLVWNPSHLPEPKGCDPEAALTDTLAFWRDWSAQCTYKGEWRDAVMRSLVTLKALTYNPTGGIVAAATTSLPEAIGGNRNWDYRYSWLRDAAMTLQALMGTGYVDEAHAWREWLVRAIAGDPADLQIMYGVAGERRLVEYTLDWLPGYEKSAPVRIGNAAAEQFQLDVYGEVMEALELARSAGLAPAEPAWDIQLALMDFLEGHWRDPDSSLWEMRGPRRQFTHSKMLAWAGVDRSLSGIQKWGLPGPADRWKALRDEIHADILANGWDDDLGSFVQYYGAKHTDASLLLMPAVGFLPGTDPRVIGTIDAVKRELLNDGFVQRYSTHDDATSAVDGLSGEEGSFLVCTFWLADALALSGQETEAREVFERLLTLRNDVGLLAEEYDVKHRRQLGNVPQAFSHMGLVNTARNLSASEAGPARERAHSGSGDGTPEVAR